MRQPSQGRAGTTLRGRTDATPAYKAPVPLMLILGSIGEMGFQWAVGAMYTSG